VKKPIRDVRAADGRLLGYQPTGRFIEVPYSSYADWLGMTWRPGFPIDRPAPDAIRKPSDAAVKASTCWLTFDAYLAKHGLPADTTCPGGRAWLGPDDNDRLVFLTGVMWVRINEVRPGRRRI
jgi:hypothetical protein